MPAHHPAARVVPLVNHSISRPSAATPVASEPHRVASQPTAAKENQHYKPGGAYYKQRFAYNGVEGPSSEVFKHI